MQVIKGYETFKSEKRPIVITIGNFDGVHIGHKSIFKKVVDRADAIKGVPIVMTFDPHPVKILAPSKTIALISASEAKLKKFEESGMEFTIVEEFTKELANKTARTFFEEVLVKKLKVKEIFIGYDFTFGKGREGTPDLMKKLGDEYKIPVTVISPVKIDNEIVSSTLIRKALIEGNLNKSERFLGYPYELYGKVVRGAARGKDLGYPTANIEPANQVIPQIGIYITAILLDNKLFNSVTSIGVRPTFKDKNPSTVIETFIFDFNKDIYGKPVILKFLKRIRDEERFNSIEELKRAISKDVKTAQEYFSKK